MMRGARGSRGRGRRGIGRVVRAIAPTKRSVSNRLKGIEFTPKVDPPRINPRPWKLQTLSFIGKGIKIFKDTDVSAAILKQNCLSLADITKYRLIFRLFTIKLWQQIPRLADTGTPTSLKSPITLRCFSLVGEGNISIQTDVATETRYARLGYRWPATETIICLSSTGSDELFTIAPVDTDQSWTVHLSVCWTTDDVSSSMSLGKEDGIVYNIQDLFEGMHLANVVPKNHEPRQSHEAT